MNLRRDEARAAIGAVTNGLVELQAEMLAYQTERPVETWADRVERALGWIEWVHTIERQAAEARRAFPEVFDEATLNRFDLRLAALHANGISIARIAVDGIRKGAQP